MNELVTASKSAASLRNLEAEQALLGAILTRNAGLEKVARYLRPEHFADPANGKVYQVMSDLIGQGRLADVFTLKSVFESDGVLSEIGGVGYLARLAGSAITVINADDYGRTIYDCHLRRQLVGIGEQLISSATGQHEVEALRHLEAAEASLHGLGTNNLPGRGAVQVGNVLPAILAGMEKSFRGEVTAIPTGFVDLDWKLSGGLEPGQLTILAARPAMGKTSLSLGIAENMAKQGRVVLFASLEMSSEELARRLMAPKLGVAPNQLKQVDRRDQGLISRALELQQDMAGLPLAIDDSPAQSCAHIRSTARSVRSRYKRLDCIIVDHLGRMTAGDTAERRGRYEKITEISAGLKALAKDLRCPVIALCQLSRGVEGREDKRPSLSDLRDSGSIEEDADIVAFLYRESYYLKDDVKRRENEGDQEFFSRVTERNDARDRARGVADLIVAKHRDGAPGSLELHFDEDRAVFSNMERR
jgi:replicative DNA helicase